jgi:glycosyltransferase involved in cell wall biosynthesis
VAHAKFTILITTKNRLDDLAFTLDQIDYLLQRKDVTTIICDDGATDGTSEFLKQNYPEIHLIRNEKSKGLIYSRNKLLSLTKSEFAISLDDDAHFITKNPLEFIEDYFGQHPECGLIGLRVFWGKNEPDSVFSSEKPHRMKSFVGCGHVWRMEAWRQIPDYPAWFIFHGEEDFAAYQMFRKKIEIHYLPSVLVNHRVDLTERKKQADYTIRLRRSLRSGWYLYFLFLPWSKIPYWMAYSVWIQLKAKVFKGDFKALQALTQAGFDLVVAVPKIIRNCNRLTKKEYEEFDALENIKLYWKPEK